MENNENNVNEKCTGKCKCKILSIIAIALSVISIIFSSIALIKGNKHPRDFFGNRPHNMQGCMWGNGFDFNQLYNFQGPGFDNNFGGKRGWNSNNNFGNNRNFGGNRGSNFNGNQGGNHNWNNNNNFGGNRGGNFNNNRPGQFNNNSTNDGGPTVAPETAAP